MNGFSLLLVLLVGACMDATGRAPRTLVTDSGTVNVHYHRSGGISTVEWLDRSERFGLSYALDAHGRELVRFHTRRIAGHANAHFTYHANGAVASVEFSDAPDGGIQWYRSTTRFDEAGNRTAFDEQGHDDYGPLPRPGRMLRQEAPAESCLVPVVNEYYVVNPLRTPALVHLRPLAPSPVSRDTAFVLFPGDTLQGGAYATGAEQVGPQARIAWTLTEVHASRKGKSLRVGQTVSVEVNPALRRHYLVLDQEN